MSKEVGVIINKHLNGIKAGHDQKIVQALLDHLLSQPELQLVSQNIVTTPAGSDICENCLTYTSFTDDCKCHIRNEDRLAIRAALQRELGTEAK